jgi:hypothetical protein
MTRKDKSLLVKCFRLELQAKIGPLFDVAYSVIVVLIGIHILIPILPDHIGLLLTIILLLSGISLRGANKGVLTKRYIAALLKALVNALDAK